MSHHDGSAHYWIRAAEELQHANQAASATAAAVHRDHARRYGALAAQADSASSRIELCGVCDTRPLPEEKSAPMIYGLTAPSEVGTGKLGAFLE